MGSHRFARSFLASWLIIPALSSACFCAETPRTIRAASLGQLDVQAAIDSARDGDTVILPPGEGIWTSITPKAPCVIIRDKQIAVVGAGIDRTVINDRTGNDAGEMMLRVYGVDKKPFRISGITFKEVEKFRMHSPVSISGTCRSWRIDHCRFLGNWASAEGPVIVGNTYGLIDNCVFNGCDNGVTITADNAASWNEPLGLGSAKAVYIEDCVFDYAKLTQFAVVAQSGARVVVRSCKMNNAILMFHGYTAGLTGCVFSYEIYGNLFTTNRSMDKGCAIELGGGTGVIFNNSVVGYQEAISVTNRRSCKGGGDGINGFCDGSNPKDGNKDPSGYPAIGQIGRSTAQSLEPLYEWNNRINGGDANVFVNALGTTSILKLIKEKRDFYNDTPRPSYKPCPYPHPFRVSQLLDPDEPPKGGKSPKPNDPKPTPK